MTTDRDLTDDRWGEPDDRGTTTGTFALDESTITGLWVAAKAITQEVDEQAWLVVHAVRAGMAPTTLANLNPHDVPTRLGIFDVADD